MWADEMRSDFTMACNQSHQLFSQEYTFHTDPIMSNLDDSHENVRVDNDDNLQNLSSAGRILNMAQNGDVLISGESYERVGANEIVVGDPNPKIMQYSANGKTNRKLNSNKVCRVCGDKAIGYNFDVISCESCKAFFRRNALRKKALRCPGNNDCVINASTRKCCKKCRLRICFRVGMKAEYIMNDEQRAEKRKRLLERSDGECESDQPGGSKSGSTGSNNVRITEDSVNFPIDQTRVSPQSSGAPVSFDESLLDSHRSSLASSADDTVAITIRVPRSALFDILFSHAESWPAIDTCIGTDGNGIWGIGQSTIDEYGLTGSAGTGTSHGHPLRQEEGPSNALVSASSSLLDTDSLDSDVLDSLAASIDINWQLPVLSVDSFCINLKLAKLDELIAADDQWKSNAVPPNLPRNAGDFRRKDYSNLLLRNDVWSRRI